MNYNTDWEGRIHFLNWQFHGVNLGEKDPRGGLFSEEAWLISADIQFSE